MHPANSPLFARHRRRALRWLAIALLLTPCLWTLSGFLSPRLLHLNFADKQLVLLTTGRTYSFLVFRPDSYYYTYPTWRYGAPAVHGTADPDGWLKLNIQ